MDVSPNLAERHPLRKERVFIRGLVVLDGGVRDTQVPHPVTVVIDLVFTSAKGGYRKEKQRVIGREEVNFVLLDYEDFVTHSSSGVNEIIFLTRGDRGVQLAGLS